MTPPYDVDHLREKPTHLVDNLIASLTACGMAGKWSAVSFSNKTKEVTCKLCLKTHWFKDQDIKDREVDDIRI